MKTKKPNNLAKIHKALLIAPYHLLSFHMLAIKTHNSEGSLPCFLYFHILI